MKLPKDPIILLSYINTQLRDNYGSLDELCQSLTLDKQDITTRLSSINYEYDESVNRFK
ncbi:MAG: DUF4250 domain-containing protein [Eubacteriales bacterium]|nr:DUF4250 domain-containing protein [Eubacteriales bacterium]